MQTISKMEFKVLMAGLREVYPSAKLPQTISGLDAWFAMLSDLTYQELSNAILEHTANSKFAPSISELRHLARKVERNDWSAGWGIVVEAIRKFGYIRPQEALDYISGIDPIAGEITRRLDFMQLCMSENLGNDRANFRMAYEAEMDKKRHNDILPITMQKRPALFMTEREKQAKERARDIMLMLAENNSMESKSDKSIDEMLRKWRIEHGYD